jgi:hypothetical protein
MTRRSKMWLAATSVAVACGSAAACSNAGQTSGAGQQPTSNAQSGSASSGDTQGATDDGSSGTGTASGASTSGSGVTTGAGSSGAQAADDAGVAGPHGDAGSTVVTMTPHMGNTCLMAGSGDYTKAGPYQVAKKAVDLGGPGGLPDAGPTTYTIFYPQPFDANCLAPIVAWGNGTGVTGSDVYAFFNNNAASWGIVVIASDNSNTGSGAYHKSGIDYLLKQNQDSSSIFYHKLSTRAGVAGHSQGGIGATQGANLIGANCEAEVCVAGGGVPPKGTAFICLTGSADLAEQGCTAAYTASQGQAFLADWDGGDHTTTETLAGYLQMQPGTMQMMRLYAAWFRCFLADDQVACKLFEGGAPAQCGICKDPGWHVLSSKNL